ncbi:MAG: hypothetical protein ABJA98_11340 [Acidobacteriota bacterium]
MPGLDGFEFIARLRATPAGAQVPIFVWTVKDLDTNERLRLEEFGGTIASQRAGGAQTLVEELGRIPQLRPAAPGA